MFNGSFEAFYTFVGKLKICIGSFGGIKIIFDRIRLLNIVISVLHYRIWCLCNLFLPQLLMNLFETLSPFFVDKMNMCMCSFDGNKISFDRITAF